MRIHNDLNYRTTCLHCKKPLPVKYISKEIDDELKEILFLDSHKVCARRAFEIAVLENEIKLQEKNLVKLRRRYATLKTKEIIKTCEVGATLN